ncbi:MAG TPA: SGNH/GDSL hydrolase family protein, partial [Pilimelia sp.]|nr:SGNH/GDSL hydrolase family protein [Pilimelia sp.]
MAAGLVWATGLVVPAGSAVAPPAPAGPDRAVTTSGDETGLHILVADNTAADTATYRWRTAATLAEPGVETDQWIGQLCLTGSGRRAVVVYAPRQFTNREDAMASGGFAAVVDLDSGAVTKLAERVSLAYYNPACGVGETAVVSRLEYGAGAASTWLGVVDTAGGARLSAVRTRGQVTSAIPYRGRLIAAKGNALVEVAPGGAVREVARTGAVPFRLMPDGADSLAFQTVRGADVELWRLAGGTARPISSAPAGAVKLRPGTGGRVYVVGGNARKRTAGRLPGGWRAVDAPPDSAVSTTGALVVTRSAAAPGGRGPVDGLADPVAITTRPAATRAVAGAVTRRVVNPDVAPAGLAPSPARRGHAAAGRAPAAAGRPPAARALADHSTTPWDPDRACAVPRNDPTIQVFQPSPKQVEWAANLAVRGQLTFQRPANWLNNGLPAYAPQGLFPSKPLAGGGYVPVQVLLGILAQESNMWQASFHAVDGSTGNPLTSSGFYGIRASADADPRAIDWTKADCGYGAAQVTTGMRVTDTNTVVNGVLMDYTKQKAVALDYATNVAAGLRILQDKWNVTRGAGLIANDGDPSRIENWWFAIWAYNTGFYPQSGAAPWGVGWANNPANPHYPPDRKMFLTAPLDVPSEGVDDEVGYDNAKHPNHWSYPERVIGFAYTSLRRYDYSDRAWVPTYL